MDDKEAVRLFRKARALYQTEQYADALALFERVERLEPDSSGVWHAHAWCLARMGRYSDARELCRKLNQRIDPRATDLHDFLESQRLAEEVTDRPKNPETVIGAPPLVAAVAAQPQVVEQHSAAPRTWRAWRSGLREPEPGGIRCARNALVAAAGGGLGVLLLSFLLATMYMQNSAIREEIDPELVALIMLGLGIELVVVCLAALAWQQISTGRTALAVTVAIMLLAVFPLGTALAVLILLGLLDADSKKWLYRAALRRHA